MTLIKARPSTVSSDAEMTASLWCVKAADHPKVMDLTKAERCDWSNRSEMIETDPSWQTDARPQLFSDTWTGWFDGQAGRGGEKYAPSSLWRRKPRWRSFMQQHIHWLDCIHVRIDRQSTSSRRDIAAHADRKK